jgi:hypothetical protein
LDNTNETPTHVAAICTPTIIACGWLVLAMPGQFAVAVSSLVSWPPFGRGLVEPAQIAAVIN